MKNSKWLLFIGFWVWAFIIGISFGNLVCFDFKNYHIYNAWAFLNNRIGFDIMPAGIQSYFNPFLDTLMYITIKIFNNHPLLIHAILWLPYALLLFLIYLISDCLFKNLKYRKLYNILSVLCAMSSYKTAFFQSNLTHDILITDFMLIALYLIFKCFYSENTVIKFSIAGFILGITLGLKYTAIMYAIPFFITPVLFKNKITSFWKSYSFFGIFFIAGFSTIAGWWMFELLKTFHNPFMPYFNSIFHSNIINTNEVFSVDFGYLTSSLKNKFTYPLFTTDELRFLLLWIFIILNTFISIYNHKFGQNKLFARLINRATICVDFFFVWFALSYVVWVNLWGTPRYILPVTCLTFTAGIVVSLKFYLILRKKFSKKVFADTILHLLLFAGVLFVANGFLDFTIKQPIHINSPYLYVEKMDIEDNANVLVVYDSAIILPFQNKNSKYIHIPSLFFTKKDITFYSEYMRTEIKNLLNANKNTIYIISQHNFENIPAIVKFAMKDANTYSQAKEKIDLETINKYKEENIATLYEIYQLGININNLTCKEIHTNIIDINPLYSDKNEFYLCHALIR